MNVYLLQIKPFQVPQRFVDAGTIAITAFISPYREDRDEVRDILEDGEFIEVYTVTDTTNIFFTVFWTKT
jgi:adenylylsulfate kinase-like enzyme